MPDERSLRRVDARRSISSEHVVSFTMHEQ
jgi:hypothetical protein